MITVGVRKRDSAELRAQLFDHRLEIVGGRGRCAVDQREPVILCHEVAVHWEQHRIPGQLNQLGAEVRDLHVADVKRSTSVGAPLSLTNRGPSDSALGVRRGAGELDADEGLITMDGKDFLCEGLIAYDTGVVSGRDRV